MFSFREFSLNIMHVHLRILFKKRKEEERRALRAMLVMDNKIKYRNLKMKVVSLIKEISILRN